MPRKAHDDGSRTAREFHHHRLSGGSIGRDCPGGMDLRRPCGAAPPARRPRGARRDAAGQTAGGRMSATATEDRPARRRLLVLLPLVVFLALAALFFFRL